MYAGNKMLATVVLLLTYNAVVLCHDAASAEDLTTREVNRVDEDQETVVGARASFENRQDLQNVTAQPTTTSEWHVPGSIFTPAYSGTRDQPLEQTTCLFLSKNKLVQLMRAKPHHLILTVPLRSRWLKSARGTSLCVTSCLFVYTAYLAKA